MTAAYLIAALASVLIPALAVWASVRISDALQARHDARSSGADEDDRAVEFEGFVPFHSQITNSSEG